MAFNIMIGNTDDHTKNHSFLRSEDGYWWLSPAYDITTQMNGLGLKLFRSHLILTATTTSVSSKPKPLLVSSA
jgi:serine/threonine protein kinase HipA of HipAB toxin-antitoxin module